MTYNHEKYIRKALDGFVQQQTTFEYKVIVHDDASTDRTPEIIREYVDLYPNIFIPILQEENTRKKGIAAWNLYVWPLLKESKYMACCEGDDYWCDADKLQSQYDALEKHPQSNLCLHKVGLIRENGDPTEWTFPEHKISSGEHSTSLLLSFVANDFFQLSSFFMRTNIRALYVDNPPTYLGDGRIGDIPLMLWFGSRDNFFYYIDKQMSCYRTNSIGGFNDRMKGNDTVIIEHELSMKKMIDIFNEETENKYIDICKQFKEQEIFSSSMKRFALVEILKDSSMRLRFSKVSIKGKIKLVLGWLGKCLTQKRKME